MSNSAMPAAEIRPMCADDWAPVTIEPQKYFNPRLLIGWQRRDGRGGNPLHPICGDEGFERELAQRLAGFRAVQPGIIAERRFVRMPYWTGPVLPQMDDYAFIAAPERLTTTSVTIALVPNEPAIDAQMGFYFDGEVLPSLRQRMRGGQFCGLAGNLGYFMTKALVERYPWAHNVRYPRFPLRTKPSYIGFYLFRDSDSEKVYGSFQGAHPGAVGVRREGTVEILPDLRIGRYEVTFQGADIVRLEVEAIDLAVGAAGVMAFTPAFNGTPEIQKLIANAEAAAGTDDGWQACKPMVPTERDWVHVFVANEGDGRAPVEKVVALWDGPAPIPSFGAVLSFRRGHFESLFDSIERFEAGYVGARVQVVPGEANADLDAYTQVLGGLVPAVVDGGHIYHDVESLLGVMRTLSRYGATSPLAQCGRETKNFDLWVREPTGVLIQTEERIGWVLFDGRHELSIGAGVVDVAAVLKKLEDEGVLGGRVRQAVFVDGGSAMKAYNVRRDDKALTLDLLNRVAAGSRNGPGADPEGLNLYTLLELCAGKGASLWN